MRFARKIAALAALLFAAAPFAALPSAHADIAIKNYSQPAPSAKASPVYLFERTCKTGLNISIVTPSADTNAALTKLLDGKMSPYDFIAVVRANALPGTEAGDESNALDLLANCMDIKIETA